jgi:predicted GNAT superfamily acetyltransferase
VALQEETWGAGFSERVPSAILKVGQRIGGITAGAFDETGRMLGFVFGLTGVERGRLVHWSDMLAVRPEARDLGVGRRLKEYQRDVLRTLGVELIYWTYDPLVARNAHLNLNRLGARVVEYVTNMYGAETESPLHRGIGSDRFVVAWQITGDEPAPPAPQPVGAVDAPVANATRIDTPDPAAAATPAATRAADPTSTDPIALGIPLLRVEIPCDIGAVQATSLEEAARWRHSTRHAFTTALDRGYHVTGFYRDSTEERCYYVLGTEC